MSSQSSVRCPKCGAERGGRNDDDAGCNRHSPMEPWPVDLMAALEQSLAHVREATR